MSVRWMDELCEIISKNDYTILETAGSEDYQGSGVILASGRNHVVFAWDYGSCSGCDRWEGREETMAQDVEEEIQTFDNLEEAYARFKEEVSRIW